MAASPWMTRPWRRAAWLTLLLVVVARIITDTVLPMELVIAIATGVTVGAAVLVAFGVPDRRIGAGEIAGALRSAGLPAESAWPADVEAKGSRPFAAGAAQRVRIARPATLIRGPVPDRPPPLRPVGKGRGLAPDPPAVLDELGSQGLIDWSRAIADAACVRAEKGAPRPAPSPVDRGKPGSKIHVLSDRAGLPLSVALSAANVNDAFALKPLVRAIPAIRSRRGPRRRKPAKLHADKAYDQADLRAWLRGRGIAVRIARKGTEASDRLGRHRWVIERTIAWLTGYRRLTLRYERNPSHSSPSSPSQPPSPATRNSPNLPRRTALSAVLPPWRLRLRAASLCP